MQKFLLTIVAACMVMAAISQNKDIDKGKEILAKAFTQTDMAKKNEMIQKSAELFAKGGMKREFNYLIGDAFLEHNELTQAASYYGRCDKGEKADGYKKLADAYVDLAFNEPKAEAKHLKNAVNYFNKSASIGEGAKKIGDRFFEMGEGSYAKALDYYFMAKDTADIEKVADKYAEAGGEKTKDAIEVYKRVGTKSAYITGGDLAFKNKQYDDAYLMYSTVKHAEGLRKCAMQMYDLGNEDQANKIYLEMVSAYMKTARTDEVNKLGEQNVAKKNYLLASQIYDIAGEKKKSLKYLGYHKVTTLELDSAKIYLEEAGDDVDLVKSFAANETALSLLRMVKNDFEDWVRQKPKVEYDTDANGKLIPKATDESMLIDYYKNIKDAIVEDVTTISKNVPLIKNAQLKELMKASFHQYPAVKNILDNTTLATFKLPKNNIQVKDVYLK